MGGPCHLSAVTSEPEHPGNCCRAACGGGERLLLNHANTPGFLAPGGESNSGNFQEKEDKSKFLDLSMPRGLARQIAEAGIRGLELLATEYLFCSRQL